MDDPVGKAASERIGSAVLSLAGRMRSRSHRYQIEAYALLISALILGSLAVVYFVSVPQAAPSVMIEPAGTRSNISIDTINFPAATWVDVVKEGILRFGSVLVAIFVVQILVAFARYRMRVAFPKSPIERIVSSAAGCIRAAKSAKD